MASEVIYVTIDAPTVESIPTTIAGSPTNVVDVDVIGDYNALITLINNAVPTGTIIQGGWTTEPPNFKFLNGQTLTGGVALYPSLATYYPSWVSGADIVLPNMSGLVMLGTTGTAGTRPITSNSKTVTITANHMAAHNHSVSIWAGVENQGHVHYITTNLNNGAAGGTAVGGWAPTWDMYGVSVNHVHGTWTGSPSSFVTNHSSGSAYMNTTGNIGVFQIESNTGYINADHDHGFATWGHLSGAHQQHQHLVSGNTADSAPANTPLPYDTTPAHMLVKFAVKL
jgi:hypothetical protein